MDSNRPLLEVTPAGEIQKSLARRVWEEERKIWRVAFPAILNRVCAFGLLVVTQSFIGRVNQLDLAAYALVQTITFRFSSGILIGMSSATETLCGQAFGAKQYHMLGIYLQRSWIVDSVITTLMLPVFIFASSIFKLLGEEDEIAEASETISLWFIPFIYNSIFYLTIQMFLQAQMKNMVIGWLCAISFVAHILMSWVTVYKLNWGVPGAMGSLNLSRWIVVIGEWIYVFGGWCPDTWRGFTTQAFMDLIPIVKLSLSSALMLCLELWYTAILVLLAGYTSNAVVEISAFSICINLYAWVFMVFLGFLGASCVRVANELGKGDAEAAKFAVKVCLSTSSSLGVVVWLLFLIFDRQIAYIFTNDEEVADAVTNLSILLAFTILLGSLQTTFSGIAIGSGSQAKVAIINLCSYYVVGVPIGVVLAYVADLGIKGIWYGLICGLGLQVLLLIIMTWRIDWNDEVKKASCRLNQFLMDSVDESSQGSNQP